MLSKFFDILKKAKKIQEDFTRKTMDGNMVIPRIRFHVCSFCQNNCKSCANKELLKNYKNYQLSMHELNRFIYYTKKSNYYYGNIRICGAGEPTLWDHFDEGVKLLYNSGITSHINMISNGISVDNINEETWGYLDHVTFSIFPNTKNKDYLDALRKKYGKDKINFLNYNYFHKSIDRRHINTTPCKCLCPGPTFIKDKVFFYCTNGPLFTAAKIRGVDIFDHTDMYSGVKENYLDRADISIIRKREREFEFCEYCGANANLFPYRNRHKHVQLKNDE